jgi:predicted dehydrogenase
MRKVRVAVVGCGKVSEHYLSHLQQSAAVELVAVCDPLIERAQGSDLHR